MPVAASIHHGTLPLILSGPRPSYGTTGALDSLSFEVLTHRASWITQAAAVGFSQNSPVTGYPGMWTLTLDMEEESELTAIVRVSCLGILGGGDKRRRRMSVAGREIAVGPNEVYVLAWSNEEIGSEIDGSAIPSGKVKRLVPKVDSFGQPVYKIITTPIGTGPRWNTREAIVVVSDTYFTTVQPDMAAAGLAYTPPAAPTPPAYIWGGYVEPMRYNYPAGWILDDRQVEQHFPALWEVTDTCGFYYAAQPD